MRDGKRSTSPTLLGRLRDEKDQDAWTSFCARYAPRMNSWCRQRRLGRHDTDDLTQNVLIRVVKLIRSEWVYDPGQNFSGLLRTLWERAFCDWLRERTRRPDQAAGGDGKGEGEGEGADILDTLEAGDFVTSLRDFLEWEELEEALARLKIDRSDDAELVRARLKGESVAQIAERLGRKKVNVAMQVSRAIERLRKVLGALGSGLSLPEEQT